MRNKLISLAALLLLSGCGILAILIQFCVSVHNTNVNMMPIQMTPEPARSHE